MADNKNTIVVYADWIDQFESLTDEEAGRLIKHFFRYVNDMNPVADRMTELLFTPIKQSLKRDLMKWEQKKTGRSDSGRLGNLKRWYSDLYDRVIANEITIDEAENIANHRKQSHSDTLRQNESQTVANIAVTDTVSVTVSDSDILLEKVTKGKFNFVKSLCAFGFEKDLVSDWILVRKNKKLTNSKTVFEQVCLDSEKGELELGWTRNEILKFHVEKSWGGFNPNWIKKEITENNKNLKDEPKVGRMPISVAIKNATGWGDIEV